MTDHLTTNSPFTGYHKRTESVYSDIVRPAFHTFRISVGGQIESLVNDIKVVASQEKQIPETEQAPGLAQELQRELEAVNGALNNACVVFEIARAEVGEEQNAPNNS